MGSLEPLRNSPLPESPWGALPAAYFVLLGIPCGLTLVAQWMRVQYPDRGARTSRYATWLCLGITCAAALLLMIDLGRPERFFLMLTRFDNLGSPLSLGAKLLGVKIALLASELYLFRGNRSIDAFPAATDRLSRLVDRFLRASLIVISIGLVFYPVAALSRTWLAPIASTNGAALLYVTSALLMGAAAFSAVDTVVHHKGPQESAGMPIPLVTGLVVIHLGALLFTWLEIPGDSDVTRLTMPGAANDTNTVLWGIATLAAVIATPGLARLRTRTTTRVTSSIILITGVGAARYLVFAGI